MTTALLFHDFTDIRAWQALWERRLQDLYYGEDSAQPIIDKTNQHEQLDSLDEYSFSMREEGTRIVLEQGRVLWARLAMDSEERGFAAWRGETELEREEIVLAVLAKRHGGSSEYVREKEVELRALAPEITLGGLAGGDGEGLIELARAVVPTEGGMKYAIVRHARFERLWDFQLDEGKSLPKSKVVRAYQEDQLLMRHSYLLFIVLGVLSVLVSLISLIQLSLTSAFLPERQLRPHSPRSL